MSDDQGCMDDETYFSIKLDEIMTADRDRYKRAFDELYEEYILSLRFRSDWQPKSKETFLK